MVSSLKRTTALALAAGLAGGQASAQVNLTTATAAPGSIVYVTTHHLARVAGERGIAALQVGDGVTLTNAVLDLAEGRLDMSESPIILPFMLARGVGPFANVAGNGAQLVESLRVLFPYNAGLYALYATSSSNIDSWDDLEGRTVFNGPPRGAALGDARRVITLITGLEDGAGYTGFQANWGQLNTLLTDGTVDAFVMPSAQPSERVTVLQSAGAVNLVSTPREVFESEEFQRLFQIPGNIPIELNWADLGYSDNVHLLESDDGILRGMGTAFASLVRADMDYQLAYDLTAAYVETLDELRASTPYAANAGHGIVDERLSGFCGANPLRYHPGAVAAWEDRGYDIPDCAESQ